MPPTAIPTTAKPMTWKPTTSKPITVNPSTAKPTTAKAHNFGDSKHKAGNHQTINCKASKYQTINKAPVSKQNKWKCYSRGSSYQRSSHENCCSRGSIYWYQREKIALITVIVSKPSRCTSCERQNSRIGNENSSNVRPSSKGSLHIIWIKLLQRELQSYYSFQVTKCPQMVIVVLLVSENNYFHSREGVWR